MPDATAAGAVDVAEPLARERERLVSLTIDDLASWTVRRNGDVWRLYDEATPDAAVGLAASREAAVLLFSRGLTADEIARELRVTGDEAMGSLIVAGFGTALGRTDR